MNVTTSHQLSRTQVGDTTFTYDLHSNATSFSDSLSKDSFGTTLLVSSAVTKLWLSLGSIILALGTISHVATITLAIRRMHWRKSSIFIYVASIAILGLVTLYMGLLREIVLHASRGAIDFRLSGSIAWCRAYVAATHTSVNVFVWLQTTLAAERALAVLRPGFYKRWRSLKLHVSITTVIVCLLALLNFVGEHAIHVDSYVCDSSSEVVIYRLQVIWSFLMLAVNFVAPPIATILFNIATEWGLRAAGARSRIERRRSSDARRSSVNPRLTRMSRLMRTRLLVQDLVVLATTVPIIALFFQSAEDDVTVAILSLAQYGGMSLSFALYSLLSPRKQLRPRQSGSRPVNEGATDYNPRLTVQCYRSRDADHAEHGDPTNSTT